MLRRCDHRPALTTPLPLPADPLLDALTEAWPEYVTRNRFPRSAWLHDFEAILRRHYPGASSRELSLTARKAAPFFLAQGHDVP